MRSTISTWVHLALASVVLILGVSAGGIAQAQALSATVTTDRGCGASAVYSLGERSLFFFSLSQTALVTLVLQRPDGTNSVLVSNQQLLGGVNYSIAGIIGNPPGQRVLTLTATAGTQSTQAQCTYSAQQGTTGGLTVTLQTNKGCGAGAVFQLGEQIVDTFSASKDANVTLTLQRPDGTTAVLANQFVQGGVTYSVTGVIGNPLGTRTLTLNASSGTETASMQCMYTAQTSTVPLTATLQTNKGCGAGAVFVPGEPDTITYSVSQTASVTLQLIRPDGSISTLVAGQTVPGGVPQTIQAVIGSLLGQRRLILDAVAGTETAHMECDYSAQQGSTGGPVTLSMNIDQGCGGTYHLGQLITVTYSASANTSLTLVDQHADGTMATIFANQPVLAGQTYSITGIIGGTTGGRTLILSAPSGTSATPATCQFNVVP